MQDSIAAPNEHSAMTMDGMKSARLTGVSDARAACAHHACHQDDAVPSRNAELRLSVSVAVLAAFSLTLFSVDLQSYPAYHDPPVRGMRPRSLGSVLRV